LQDEDYLDSTFNNWEEEKDSNIEYEQVIFKTEEILLEQKSNGLE